MIALFEAVWARANSCCEYCLSEQEFELLTFHIDHIVAIKHRGPTALDNLALACASCSLAKGPNIAGHDPVTRRLTRLFNPRKDSWEKHFRWRRCKIHGLTPIGRTTVVVLNINDPRRVTARELLRLEGKFPPPKR
jgi:HNH endonuclease